MCIAQKERERRREGEHKKWKFPNCAYSYFFHLTPLPAGDKFCARLLLSCIVICHCSLSFSLLPSLYTARCNSIASKSHVNVIYVYVASHAACIFFLPWFLFDKVLFFALFSKALIYVGPSSLLCILKVNLRVQLCCHCSFCSLFLSPRIYNYSMGKKDLSLLSLLFWSLCVCDRKALRIVIDVLMAEILVNKEQWIICCRKSFWIYNDAHNSNESNRSNKNQCCKSFSLQFQHQTGNTGFVPTYWSRCYIQVQYVVRRMAIHIRFEWQGQSFVRLNWKLQLTFWAIRQINSLKQKSQLIQHIDDFAGYFPFVNCLMRCLFYTLLLPFHMLSVLLVAIWFILSLWSWIATTNNNDNNGGGCGVGQFNTCFCDFDCERANVPDGLNQNRRHENDIHFHFTAVNLQFIFFPLFFQVHAATFDENLSW